MASHKNDELRRCPICERVGDEGPRYTHQDNPVPPFTGRLVKVQCCVLATPWCATFDEAWERWNKLVEKFVSPEPLGDSKLDQILDEMMVEDGDKQPTHDLMMKWIKSHPEYTDELSSFFATWALQLEAGGCDE